MAETPPFPRFTVPAVTAAIFASLYALHAFGQETLYQAILSRWGIVPYDFPFVDIHGVLSAIQCGREGIDVYLTNPCDVLGRVFFYSPLLLWGEVLPLDTGATQIAGLAVDLLFFAALFCLPAPRRLGDGVLMLLATLSTMTVFAVERANIDLVVFAFAAFGGALLLRPGRARLAGYALFVVAALTKFYPAALLFVTLRERSRLFIAVNAAAVALLALFVAAYHVELAAAVAHVPHGVYFGDMFGAANLPYGLAVVAPGFPARPAMVALVIMAAAGAAAIGRSDAARNALAELPPRDKVFLLIGGCLMVGCFFAGDSIGYRGVHLIFVLPGLIVLARADSRLRLLFAATAGLVLFLMWGELFRHAVVNARPGALFAFWLGRELAWWMAMSILGGLLLGFALDSMSGRLLPPLAAGPADAARKSL
ncbi:MAG TPA: hypothetical protein VFC38_06250 [Stellaceae bacterium]|nr:hypothetical protein [Stellaceae bacterium]